MHKRYMVMHELYRQFLKMRLGDQPLPGQSMKCRILLPSLNMWFQEQQHPLHLLSSSASGSILCTRYLVRMPPSQFTGLSISEPYLETRNFKMQLQMRSLGHPLVIMIGFYLRRSSDIDTHRPKTT